KTGAIFRHFFSPSGGEVRLTVGNMTNRFLLALTASSCSPKRRSRRGHSRSRPSATCSQPLLRAPSFSLEKARGMAMVGTLRTALSPSCLRLFPLSTTFAQHARLPRQSGVQLRLWRWQPEPAQRPKLTTVQPSDTLIL